MLFAAILLLFYLKVLNNPDFSAVTEPICSLRNGVEPTPSQMSFFFFELVLCMERSFRGIYVVILVFCTLFAFICISHEYKL